MNETHLSIALENFLRIRNSESINSLREHLSKYENSPLEDTEVQLILSTIIKYFIETLKKIKNNSDFKRNGLGHLNTVLEALPTNRSPIFSLLLGFIRSLTVSKMVMYENPPILSDDAVIHMYSQLFHFLCTQIIETTFFPECLPDELPQYVAEWLIVDAEGDLELKKLIFINKQIGKERNIAYAQGYQDILDKSPVVRAAVLYQLARVSKDEIEDRLQRQYEILFDQYIKSH